MEETPISMDQLSTENLLAALEAEDPIVMAKVEPLIAELAEQAALAVAEGRDYLEVLTASEGNTPLEAAVMEIVREIFDEELDNA